MHDYALVTFLDGGVPTYKERSLARQRQGEGEDDDESNSSVIAIPVTATAMGVVGEVV